MTAGSQVVKATAKTALQGKWVGGIIGSAVFIFAQFICIYLSQLIGIAAGSVSGIIMLAVLTLFLSMPLLMGLLKFFWHLLFGVDDNLTELFCFFSSGTVYLRAVQFILSFFVRIFLIGILCFLPAIAADVLSGTAVYDLLNISIPLWSSNISILSVMLKTAAVAVTFFLCARYYLSPMLFIADENMTPAEALHMSCVISKGTWMDFVFLFFSFTGWILLSVLVAPLLFTVPYFIVSYLVHSRFAVAGYNQVVSRFKRDVPTYSAGV